MPGARCPALSGPYPNRDSGAPIWIVPQPFEQPVNSINHQLSPETIA
jgi:hypothetical protein